MHESYNRTTATAAPSSSSCCNSNNNNGFVKKIQLNFPLCHHHHNEFEIDRGECGGGVTLFFCLAESSSSVVD